MTYLVVVVFVAVMVGVGVASRKRTSDVKEFFLGGRDVGPWLSAFAYGTTYFSAVLFVGYAGKIGFGFGLSSLWIAVGNALVGSLLAWVVLAKRTRLMTTRLGAMTVPAFFKERFGSNGLKIAAALIIFVFLVPYSASVYTGLAYLFEHVFDLDYSLALWGMAVLTAVYLVLGGYVAVARNDLIQGVVMVCGVVLMVGYVLRAPEVGGLSAAIDKLTAAAPSATAAWPAWDLSPFSWEAFLASPAVVLASMVVLTSLGVWGLPQMVHKFYAIRDVKAVRPALWISTVFAGLMAGAAYFTGALSRLFPGVPELAAAKQFDEIMPTVLTESLPEALVAVILVLVLSASMSTLAGLVMISGSAITVDLVQGEIKPGLSKGTAVLLLRLLVVVFILLSVVLAQQQWQLIVNLMALSWGVVAGCFIGPFVWGLFWRRVSAASVWACFAFSLAFMGGLGYYYASDPSTAGYVPVLAALTMVASLAITPLVSLVTPAPSESRVAAAFEADQGAPGGEPA
ncbi:MAG: sodium:solute symporter family protein [Actinobacteria bacterium]|nr:sodium:solute symporter family protein [Actinomycetota bacterium]